MKNKNIINEEECYQLLRRIPYEDMLDIWRDEGRLDNPKDLFEENGWKYIDFALEYARRSHHR